jgi:hypothetical protein
MATTGAFFNINMIVPKPADVAKVKQALFDALNDTNKVTQKEFDDVTGTWTHNVAFVTEPAHIRGNDGVASVGTDDKPMFWLDVGTKKPRHAVMTKNFVAKTKVRTLKSTAGAGGLAFVSQKILRPGIDARQFTTVIANDITPVLAKNVDAALKKAMP